MRYDIKFLPDVVTAHKSKQRRKSTRIKAKRAASREFAIKKANDRSRTDPELD